MANSLEKFARRLLAVEKLAKRAATTPQLAYSSIEDGAIQSVEDGTLKGIIGKQFDGTHTIAVVNGPVPPAATAPICTPALEGIRVRWDGLFVDDAIVPMDFARVEVHASTDPDFTAEFAATLVGTFETPRGGEFYVNLVPADYTVKFVVRSQTGARSAASAGTLVTPEALADSLPDSGPTDPPSASPEITRAMGMDNGILVTTSPIDATTFLDYYIDGVLAEANVRSTIQLLTADSNGEPLLPNTDYSIHVVAHNALGSAAASEPTLARLDPSLTVDQVVGILQAGMILTGEIEVGSALRINPNEGIVVVHPDGSTTQIPADGSGPEFRGVGKFDTLEVYESLDLRGTEGMNISGPMRLTTGVTDPIIEPNVVASHPSVVLKNYNGESWGSSWSRGLTDTPDGQDWVSLSVSLGGMMAVSGGYVNIFNKEDGTWTGGGFAIDQSAYLPYGGITRLGNTYYVLCCASTPGDDYFGWTVKPNFGHWRVLRFNATTHAYEGSFLVDGWNTATPSIIGNNGTSLLIAGSSAAGGNLYYRRYSTTGVQEVSSTMLFAGWGKNAWPAGITQTSTGMSGTRLVVISDSSTRALCFQTDGTRVTADEFYIPTTPARGLHLDVNKGFRTFINLRVYDHTWNEGSHKFAYAWRDNNVAGLGVTETRVKEKVTTPQRFARWTVSTPAPPDDGTTDGANSVALYVAKGSDPLDRKHIITAAPWSFDMDAMPANSGVAPSATNGFASRPGSLGSIESTETDALGNPLTKIAGKGTPRLQKLVQGGVANISLSNAATGSVDIVFDTPFESPPSLKISPSNINYLTSYTGRSTTGFTAWIRHFQLTNATSTIQVSWEATAIT